MEKEDFTQYKDKVCRIIVEKQDKHQRKFKCVFGTVEIVNERCVYVTDSKGAWFKVPFESIRGIQINEEQW